MKNGLKTATLVFAILMAACLFLVPYSADAASDNVGYGESDDLIVRYADASDGVNGKLYITLKNSDDIAGPITVNIDKVRSVSIAKDLIRNETVNIGGPQLKLCAGTHSLTVSDGIDYQANVIFTVASKVISVTLDYTDATLKVGETLTLKVEVLPADSPYGDVVWRSSDDSVVSVKDGNLTALKAGNADVTAECGGVAAVCKVTVTDVTYTLKFVSDGQDYETFQLKAGDSVVKPDDPVKEGYIFKGWDPAIPDIMPAEDMVFTAQWEKATVKHTVTFLDGYGGQISSAEVAEGAKIPVPEVPLREGYEFAGWDPEIPEKMSAEDLEFTAKWLVHKLVDNDDGSKTEVKEEIISEGGKNVSVETASSESDDGKITSQTIVKDDGTGKEAQQNVIIDTDDLTPEIVDKALTQALAERGNLSDPETEVKTTVSVNVEGTSISISPISASELKDSNTDLSIGTANGTVALDTDVLNTMSQKSGNLVLNVSNDKSDLTDEAKKTVGNRKFVNVTLIAGSDKISDLGGKATVTIDFVLSEGMEAVVHHVGDDGTKTFIESTYADEKVTFTAEEFSVYMVEEVPVSPAPAEPEQEMGIGTIVAIVVALVVVGGALVLIFLNKR